MNLYLLKGYLDQAATTLADAQSLLTALGDPSTNANVATIGKVTSKLESLVASDTGEPLVISSIDDVSGTISSWVTDNTQTLAFAIGDAFPGGAAVYANANVSTITGNTRTGTLNLSTAALSAAVSGSDGRPSRGLSTRYTAHIRRATATGATETVALFPITIRSGVL